MRSVYKRYVLYDARLMNDAEHSACGAYGFKTFDDVPASVESSFEAVISSVRPTAYGDFV